MTKEQKHYHIAINCRDTRRKNKSTVTSVLTVATPEQGTRLIPQHYWL